MGTETRSSKNASQIISEYLLKGYTLLDSYCIQCLSPLMRLKNEPSFCVICPKDTNINGYGLVYNEDAAEVIVADSDSPASPVNGGTGEGERTTTVTNVSDVSMTIPKPTQTEKNLKLVRRKMNWAVDKLDKCESVGECIQICNLIKACCDTIKVINETNSDTCIQIVNC